MSKRILGLDLGTNSIGWAVVDDMGKGQFKLVKKGVHVFQEGVKIEKGNESSKAAERTGYRAARRLKFRRKLRKIRTLRVLSEVGFCPALSEEELKAWQSKKVYPANSAFREWCKTSDPKDKKNGKFKNPYYYRWLAATSEFNLGNEADRYKLGRALYHMAQRRGFKSNRLDTTQESDGVVSIDINELSEKMNGRTLGQYFWEDCYQEGKQIRKVHTSRDEHYLAEFDFICTKQGVPDELKKELLKAIFFQRPLKSQKGLVANCPFEPNKKRVPISHPLFEEFRMWQTLNNIKIKTMDDKQLRPLTMEEKQKIVPLFFRVKPNFDFKDIAKKLTPRNQKHAYYKGRDSSEAHVKFNYRDNQSLAGCPFSAKLKNLFGEDYKQKIYDSYCGNKQDKNGEAKSAENILHEVWHVLFSFDDKKRTEKYAKEKLGLSIEDSEKFVKILPKQGYGALSLKAVKKILPFLRKGLIYSHSVFFANLDQVIGFSVKDNEKIHSDIARLVDEHNQYIAKLRCVNEFVREYRDNPKVFNEKYDFCRPQELNLPERLQNCAYEICKTVSAQINKNNGKGEYLPLKRMDERVGDYLVDNFGVDSGALKILYHPSKEETYKAAERAEDGKFYLGDPRISSIRNPVFMRAMHRVKAVINELLKQGIITDLTKINLEMARELNDANKRAAIKKWQRQKEDNHKKFKEMIEKDGLKPLGIEREATEDEILKYQLWEEQNHVCPYTGNEIRMSDFIGENPSFDIEHTIPRSLSCDNSQENKTLCDRTYNREVKKNKIPAECSNHEEILQRIEHWQDRIDELNKLIDKQKPKSRNATTKDAKDSAIQKRLLLEFECTYWREKYRRFTMKEVTSGFKNSQLVDTRIITKYARLYLKTVFATVHTVNGKTTDDFRRCWGVEKTRDNHAHHAVDAIVVACVTRDQYDELARYYHEYESYENNDPAVPVKPHFFKPWETFTEDMKELKNHILISHYYPNHLLKQTKKKLRQNGKPVLINGKPIYQQGKTARGSLHRDTFYGKIKIEDSEKYVVRVPLVHNAGGGAFGFDSKAYDKKDKNYATRQSWKTKDFERIVDFVVKEAVIKEVHKRTVGGLSFKEALIEPIWMNKEKGVQIKRVRCLANPKGILKIKEQRDLCGRESSEWKKHYYAENDVNYIISFYEGVCPRGKMVRGFKVLNNYVALNSRNSCKCPNTITVRNVECTLKQVIKIGNSVLLYDESIEELRTLSSQELFCRLYEVFGINGLDGRVQFRHHMEARDDKNQDKAIANFELNSPVSKIRISPSNMKVAIEGSDFRLNILGEIEWLDNEA